MPSVTESPYKKVIDSPSRQLLWELAQLHLNDRTSFYAKLEEDARERETQHRAALAAAAAEHDRIRQRAELECEKLQIQMDEEIAKRDARQKKLVETYRRLAAEKAIKEEQKELARAQAIEEEKRKLLEAAKAQLAAQRKAQEAQAEIDAARKLQEDQANTAKEATQRAVKDAQRRRHEDTERSAAQAARQASSPIAAAPPAPATFLTAQNQKPNGLTQPTRMNPPTGSQDTSSVETTSHLNPGRVAEHLRYLQIHKNLKKLRKDVAHEGSRNKPFKTAIGDSRRTIRKCVGQITDVKGANSKPVRCPPTMILNTPNIYQLEEIKTVLIAAAKTSQPSVLVTDFLALPPSSISPGSSSNISVALIYLLNILSKSFLAQCTNDLAVSQHSADPLGILVISMFSDKAFQYLNSVPLVDILLGKLHACCPVLFGISPPPNIAISDLPIRAKNFFLGWRIEDNALVTEQVHSDRMTGLATGFAAISLRKFRSPTKRNAYPPHNYWRALAGVVNTPTNMLTSTHFLVLKNMIEVSSGA